LVGFHQILVDNYVEEKNEGFVTRFENANRRMRQNAVEPEQQSTDLESQGLVDLEEIEESKSCESKTKFDKKSRKKMSAREKLTLFSY